MPKNDRIAIGIPFYASSHIEPLQLCLCSLKKYVNFPFELFVLINCSDAACREEFAISKILSIVGEMRVKYYFGDDNSYKQTLIDWIADVKDPFQVMFVLHSDVFLYRPYTLENMLAHMLDKRALIAYWDVPLQVFRSTYHLSEDAKKEFIVSPRVSSWIMCIDVEQYRRFRARCPLGNYLFKGIALRGDIKDAADIWNWYESICPDSIKWYFAANKAIIDHGGVMRYFIEIGEIKGASLGIDKNPNFDSMNLFYHPGGYVHIGQMDPSRYNDIFYTKALLAKRTELIAQILKDEYLIT